MRRDFIYIIIIAILLGVGYWQYDRAQAYKAQSYSAAEQTRIWRDEAGRSVAEATVWRGNYAAFKEHHEHIVDSLKETIGKGKVDNVVIINRYIHDTVTMVRGARGLEYSSRWSKFDLQGDKLSYFIYDSLSVTTYRKHYGFLGLKSKYVTDIRNANPNVTMTGARSFEIRPTDNRLGFGLSAGIAMTNYGFTGFVGVGAIYRIF
jgi:hypothetical protein